MTRRQVWQYRCEFCGKRNLSASSIAQHEQHCTKNPGRECRMCIKAGILQTPIEELKASLNISLPDEGLDQLRDLAENCPACMLAALVQSDCHRPGYTLMYGDMQRALFLGLSYGFDFKKECKAWWDEYNHTKAEEYGYY